MNDEVYTFLRDHIESIEQLEILLFVWKQRNNSSTPFQIGARLRREQASVARYLELLHGKRIVERDAEVRYRFNTDLDIDPLMTALAETFRVRPVAVAALIYSKASQGGTEQAHGGNGRGEGRV